MKGPFLLDANAFIEAKNRHYAFDICPAFWDWLDGQNSAEQVFSVRAIRDELLKGKDELSEWADGKAASFFLEPDDEVTSGLATVASWANSHKLYKPAAKTEFLGSADFQLVAHAFAKGMTVVTHEKQQNSPSRVKIPNACSDLGIEFTTLYEAIRATSATFVLAK